jgi:hypothetical protein
VTAVHDLPKDDERSVEAPRLQGRVVASAGGNQEESSLLGRRRWPAAGSMIFAQEAALQAVPSSPFRATAPREQA